MSTDSPSSSAAQTRAEQFERVKHYSAITFIIASPVLIALPPRKLDIYTVSLSTAFLFSVNHLTAERTGRSIPQHIFPSRQPSLFRDLPSEKAEQVQAQIRAAREAQIRDPHTSSEQIERLKTRQEQQEQQEKGIAERIWMGGESKGWKERRLKEEQKALEEGKGYGDLIMDHIWDVWNWGRRDGEEEDKEHKTDK